MARDLRRTIEELRAQLAEANTARNDVTKRAEIAMEEKRALEQKVVLLSAQVWKNGLVVFLLCFPHFF